MTHFHIFFEHFPDIFTTFSRQQELCVFDTFLVTYNCHSLVILFKRRLIPTYLHCITTHYTHTYTCISTHTNIHKWVSMSYTSRHTFGHSGCQATAMQEMRFRLTCCRMKSKLPILLCELNPFKKYKLHR